MQAFRAATGRRRICSTSTTKQSLWSPLPESAGSADPAFHYRLVQQLAWCDRTIGSWSGEVSGLRLRYVPNAVTASLEPLEQLKAGRNVRPIDIWTNEVLLAVTPCAASACQRFRFVSLSVIPAPFYGVTPTCRASPQGISSAGTVNREYRGVTSHAALPCPRSGHRPAPSRFAMYIVPMAIRRYSARGAVSERDHDRRRRQH
jgi:hypothetical protein